MLHKQTGIITSFVLEDRLFLEMHEVCHQRAGLYTEILSLQFSISADILLVWILPIFLSFVINIHKNYLDIQKLKKISDLRLLCCWPKNLCSSIEELQKETPVGLCWIRIYQEMWLHFSRPEQGLRHFAVATGVNELSKTRKSIIRGITDILYWV